MTGGGGGGEVGGCPVTRLVMTFFSLCFVTGVNSLTFIKSRDASHKKSAQSDGLPSAAWSDLTITRQKRCSTKPLSVAISHINTRQVAEP